MLLLIAWISEQARHPVHDRRLPAELLARCDRLGVRRRRSSSAVVNTIIGHCRPTTDRWPRQDRLPAIAGALRAAARRYGTPCPGHRRRDRRTPRPPSSGRVPGPVDPASTRVKANDVAAVVGLVTGGACGFGANVVSRGEWAIARRGRRRRTTASRSKASARPTPISPPPSGRPPIGGRPLWLAIESPDEAEALIDLARAGGVSASASRPGLDVLFRLNPDVTPGDPAGLAVGARQLEVRDDRDRAQRDGRAGRGDGPRAAAARRPPPRRVAARGGRRLARRGSARARGRSALLARAR